ncbi:Hsp70 family protein [Dactylosporangium sp. CA-152071]|uniref:Hsp70 family protein n=1 Tax=Dactylosporangium sp. CA-152071 TaxID=3239933 RepID=UPI003D90F8E7
MGVHLSVDYGTSSTVALLAWPDGRTQPLLFDSSPLLSSAVYAEADGRLLTGRDAVRAARLDPSRFEPNPKRRIDEPEVLLGDREVPVAELVAATLRRVLGEATRAAGGRPASVTVTHPVTWGPARRAILTDACSEAGLGDVDLVAEPVAAATNFAAGTRVEAGQAVVVYDLGAGTFDVSVVRRTGSAFEALAYRGLDDLGGLDLDALVVEHAAGTVTDGEASAWRGVTEPGDADGRRQHRALWDDARETKEALSRQPSAGFHVTALRRDVLVTRDEFERAAGPLLQRTVDLTLATIRESRAKPDQIAGVFLVGGGSRTPLVATLLHRATGIAPTLLEQPELVVAQGALPAAAPAAGPAAGPAPSDLVSAPRTDAAPASAPVSVPPFEPVSAPVSAPLSGPLSGPVAAPASVSSSVPLSVLAPSAVPASVDDDGQERQERPEPGVGDAGRDRTAPAPGALRALSVAAGVASIIVCWVIVNQYSTLSTPTTMLVYTVPLLLAAVAAFTYAARLIGPVAGAVCCLATAMGVDTNFGPRFDPAVTAYYSLLVVPAALLAIGIRKKA